MADETTVQETEEQQTPVQQEEAQPTPEPQEQAAEQTEWTTESLTEAIEQAAEDNDPDRMEELRKIFDSQSAEEPESAEAPAEKPAETTEEKTPTVTDAETGEQREMTEAEKKLFKVNYHGEPFEVPDENGLLGYQTTGHLKRAKVHADLRLKDLERRAEEALNEARAKAQAVAEWERKYNELKTQAPAPGESPEKAPEQPLEKVERPEPPKYPELSSSDPNGYDDEDIAKLTQWQKKHNQYLEDNAKYLDYLTQLATGKQSSPDSSIIEERVAAHTKELQERLRAAEEKLQAEEKTKAELQRKQEEEKYWNNFAKFQSQHKEFSTPVPLQDLYKGVNKWMDELAVAHGHNAPYTPYNPNSQEWQTYQRMRSAIADSYLAGNQETLAKAEGIDPPAGYDKFFELGRIYKECKPLVDKGMSLHQAYLIHLDETGQLDQTVNELRAEERSKAAKATGDALREHTQYPSAVPNSVAAQGVPGQGLSETDLNWLMSVIDDPRAYASLSKEEQKKADNLAARAGVPIK